MRIGVKAAGYRLADCGFAVLSALRPQAFKENETICLLGTSRGGTTLLAQIVCTIPRTQLLWEPLLPINNRRCEQFGFDWHHYLRIHDQDSRKRDYLQRLYSGREIRTGTLTRAFFSPLSLLRARLLVVKFVNANRLLGWMTREFLNPAVLLLRHPSAVVASQMNHRGFARVARRDWILPELVRDFPALPEIYERVTQVEEILCWDWCVDTFVALTQCDRSRVHVLTFESLIQDPGRELADLFRYLQRAVPEGAIDAVTRPSATVSRGAYVNDATRQLNRWKERLNAEQIDRIERLVRAFGLGAYLSEAVPRASVIHPDPSCEALRGSPLCLPSG